ncbi:MAG: hypothetical protein ACFFDF_16145 [Candidatus Odinarchaeota archaeon]
MCEKDCYYKITEENLINECGVPIGLRTFQHCTCGQCIIKQYKEECENQT